MQRNLTEVDGLCIGFVIRTAPFVFLCCMFFNCPLVLSALPCAHRGRSQSLCWSLCPSAAAAVLPPPSAKLVPMLSSIRQVASRLHAPAVRAVTRNHSKCAGANQQSPASHTPRSATRPHCGLHRHTPVHARIACCVNSPASAAHGVAAPPTSHRIRMRDGECAAAGRRR